MDAEHGTQRLDEVEALFHEARERAPEERAAFLDGACRGDLELRSEVESLLAHGTDGPGARPVPESASTLRERGPLQEGPGSVIGPYKLLQVLGEGGFGVVHMAEQKEPVRRRVALKVIKLGMDTKQVIARFEAERQALALMDHPNIAKVLDAGATRTGRPYFVMELVRGVPVTEYCDRAEMGTEERLRLFVKICRAVQHAHQKGIVHRDIKPSNILVTLHDGEPVPKVIDFGIAKATNQELTEKTVFTEFRQFIGTPEYMSPEQAEMSGLDIDTRADVYSLGVLLYELLTGTTPVDPVRLRSAGYDEMQRILREEEPVRPSTRLSTMGEEAALVARRRRADPEHLSRSLRGDLDWILLKALEKDRGRRYETASAFALDVERHLQHEPVVASPPSRVYRLGKFVRRNRGAVGAASALFAVLLLGVAGTSVGFLRASRALEGEQVARAEAEHSAARAREEAARQRAVAGFLEESLVAVDPWRFENGAPARVVDLLDLATEQLGSEELASAPATRARLSRVLGDAYLSRDRWEEALGQYRSAIDELEDPGADPLTFSRTARELDRIDAEAYFELDVGVDVDSLRERALAALEPLVAARDPAVVQELHEWAHVSFLRGRYEAAAELYRRTLEVAREVPEPGVDPVVAEFNLACAEARLGNEEEARRRYAAATRGLRGIVARGDARAAAGWLVGCEHPAIGLTLETDPPLPELVELARRGLDARNLGTADLLWDAASILEDIGHGEEAYALMRETVEIARGFDENRLMLGSALTRLAWLEWKRGGTDEVLAHAEEARPLLERTGGAPYRAATALMVACLVERVVAEPRASGSVDLARRVDELADEIEARPEKGRDPWARWSWWTICGEVARMHRALAAAGAPGEHAEPARAWNARLRADLAPFLERPFPLGVDRSCSALADGLLGLGDATRDELENARELAALADRTTGGRLTGPVDLLARALFRLGDVEGAVREARRARGLATTSEPVRGLEGRLALYEDALAGGEAR